MSEVKVRKNLITAANLRFPNLIDKKTAWREMKFDIDRGYVPDEMTLDDYIIAKNQQNAKKRRDYIQSNFAAWIYQKQKPQERLWAAKYDKILQERELNKARLRADELRRRYLRRTWNPREFNRMKHPFYISEDRAITKTIQGRVNVHRPIYHYFPFIKGVKRRVNFVTAGGNKFFAWVPRGQTNLQIMAKVKTYNFRNPKNKITTIEHV